MWTSIRQKIVELRKAKGWTQQDLAAALRVTRSALGHWEAGSRPIPVDYLPILSEVLGFDFQSVWMAPVVYAPRDTRRPSMPDYEVRGSVSEFSRLGYSPPRLHPLVAAEMERGYPRDTVHELIAGHKILGAGGELCWTSLDVLDCPLLTTHHKTHENTLRHLRHALRWNGMMLIPQVSVAVLTQARVYRMDLLVSIANLWIDVELDGNNRNDAIDTMRTWGLSLKELRYANRAVLADDFVRRLRTDIEALARRHGKKT